MKKIVYIALLITLASCIKQESPFKKEMDEAVNLVVLQRDTTTGYWPQSGWWNSANFLTAILRYAEVSEKVEELEPLIEDSFEKTSIYREKDPNTGTVTLAVDNYINDYYDDEGWWALTWIKAYKLTQEKKYLEMSETIFNDMKAGWSEEYGGGIYWKKNPLEYKNSIANNLFSLTAIRLYQETNKTEYLSWFKKSVEWYLNSGMYNTTNNLIEDGLDKKTCKPNVGGYYTYNQGVFIAVMVEMYNYTKEEGYLNIAKSVADATIYGKPFTNDGILCERNRDIAMGNDGIQFKGIFIRHLSFLYKVSKDERYKEFILKNAESIVKNSIKSKSFSCYWDAPSNKNNAAATISALECVIEAYNFTSNF